MRVHFLTNIDAYKGGKFPVLYQTIPRIGEKVSVVRTVEDDFKKRNLPTRLEVVDVTYHDNIVFVDLWYNQNDMNVATAAGAKLF